MDRTDQERHDPLPLAHDADHAQDAGTAAVEDADPRARWRTLPPPPTPEQWTPGHDTDPVPPSVADAEADRANREARWVIERGGGFGA